MRQFCRALPRTLKRVRSELGGKSALIVLDDATPEQIRLMSAHVSAPTLSHSLPRGFTHAHTLSHTRTHTHTHTHTHTPTYTHAHTHAHAHTHTHTNTHTHTHTRTHTHTHTHTLTHAHAHTHTRMRGCRCSATVARAAMHSPGNQDKGTHSHNEGTDD